MKKLFTLSLFLIITTLVLAQSHKEKVLAFQKKLNEEFLDPEKSPLTPEALKSFSGHPYFPIDKNFRVEASFKKTASPFTFQMKTSANEMRTYDKYGEVTFKLNGQTFTLYIYQSHRLRETEEYKDYLFLPFTDLTNGEETYGGGRYIDLRIPEGDTMVIDFNKAYNPSCAYSHRYSCPIPPKENDLDIRITAGVKDLDSDH